MSDMDAGITPEPDENIEDLGFNLEDMLVDVPSRGRDAMEVDPKEVTLFVTYLPQVPEGKGLQVPGKLFKSRSSATGWGNKMKEAIIESTRDDVTDANGNVVQRSIYETPTGDQRLMLTVRQAQGQPDWTCAIRIWDRP